MDTKQLSEPMIESIIQKACGKYRSGDSYTFEDVWNCVEVALSHSDAVGAPQGWKLVPITPTGVMKDAGHWALPVGTGGPWTASAVYQAMIDQVPDASVAPAAVATIEQCARIADKFTCGTCGMDGKAAAAIRQLAAPMSTVAADAVAQPTHCNLCEQAYDPACQECHTDSMADRLIENISTIRELQKALAYWMPKVFDERSAHDAYLLVGYDGEDEFGYWEQRETAQPDERAAFEDGDERALFIKTLEDFEDCNETDTDDRLLMKWACAGLLECNTYLVTEKGKAAFDAERAASQGEKQ